MYIKANSIVRFITDDLHMETEPDEVIGCWKEILRYPREGWWPLKQESGVLDPGMVIGRMFCNYIDVSSTKRKGARSQGRASFSDKIDNGLTDPISWLLRILGNDSWEPGQVLSLLGEKVDSLSSIVEEIRAYWPVLFVDCQDRHEELVDDLIRAQNDINSRHLFHISAPYFHKKWEEVLRKDRLNKVLKQDDPSEITPSAKEKENAKRQWSMTVGIQMETFINNYTESEEGKNSISLQSGGGHVLLAVQGVDGKDEIQKEMKRILGSLEKQWVDEQGWSPYLLCTCKSNDNRHYILEEGVENVGKAVDKATANGFIVEQMNKRFEEGKKNREIARRRWSGFGTPGRVKDDDSEECQLYLDVINLSEKCWPKEFESRELLHSGKFQNLEDGEKQKWDRKLFEGEPRRSDWDEARTEFDIARSRDDTRNGFLRSRVMTSMIESTFGYILAQHIPSSIESMGGDEMTAIVRKRDILEIYLGIESHMQKFYSELVVDTESLYGNTGNIWWIAWWRKEEQIPDLSAHKDVVRGAQKDWGGNFVVPMWRKMTPG